MKMYYYNPNGYGAEFFVMAENKTKAHEYLLKYLKNKIVVGSCQNMSLNTSVNDDIIIGNYRFLPKGTNCFSAKLQENISFKLDQIVKISATIYGSNDYCYGTIQIVSPIHGIYGDKANGDIGFNISETTEYKPGN